MKISLKEYDHVIVYQFGKVGSSTLKNTFSQYCKTSQTRYINPKLTIIPAVDILDFSLPRDSNYM